MRYLLDTMIVSEPAKPARHDSVLVWLESVSHTDIAVSVLTLGEIKRGVSRMNTGK
jgi:predicted nucleic acid-binding protein